METEADNGDQPTGHGSAQITAVSNTNRLFQTEQTCIDKTDRGDRYGTGRLHHGSNQSAGENASKGCFGGAFENGAKRVTG